MDAGDTTYANFNMNDEMASFSHDWKAGEYPVANGTKYNYFEMSKVEVKDLKEMIAKIAEFYEAGEKFGVVEVPIEDESTYDQVSYISNGISYRLTSDVSDAYLQTFAGSSEDVVLVAYYYYNYEEGWDDGDYSEEDYIWIDEILDDKFGEGEYREDEYWEDEYWEDKNYKEYEIEINREKF